MSVSDTGIAESELLSLVHGIEWDATSLHHSSIKRCIPGYILSASNLFDLLGPAVCRPFLVALLVGELEIEIWFTSTIGWHRQNVICQHRTSQSSWSVCRLRDHTVENFEVLQHTCKFPPLLSSNRKRSLRSIASTNNNINIASMTKICIIF